MTRSQTTRAPARKHRDRQIEEIVHDPYLARAKPPEPTACKSCGLVYQKGRWQRATAPAGAHEQVCPACHRIQDRNPAGYVTLQGSFGAAHAAEILALVRNEEAREASQHPLQRIMGVDAAADATVVTTTDVHLARRIGDALHAAFGGELDVKYSPDEYRVRVSWRR
ncbi:MAG TPA: BCAM0308 family protein [Burkholderiales bacterium]|nr:BCAM0308 family protein [Burkholderiales bacterium]